MKKFVLSVLLCAFAVSFSPLEVIASDTSLAKEELPFFIKKKKGAKTRYRQSKPKETYIKKNVSRKKKKSVY